MSIRFYCPLGHRLVVPDERAGKKGRCPQCHQKVYVPVANPRPNGQTEPPLAGHAIELDQTMELDRASELENAGGVPPVILDAPHAGVRGGQSHLAMAAGRRATGAFGPVDFRDPLALALDEITAMPQGKSIVYMPITEEAPSHSGSVSKLLPPKPAKVEPEAAPAQGPPVQGSPVLGNPSAAPGASPGAPLPMADVRPFAPAPVAAVRAGAPPRAWLRAAEPDEIARAFRPDEIRLQFMYLLAGALMLLALASSWPALTHFRRSEAAPWVVIVLFMSAANLIYVVWLLSLADWSTLRVGMVLCACCAATYACGLAIVMGSPDARTLALGLDEVRTSAGLWCALQMGLLGGACYGFGRQAGSWRNEARGDW